LQQVKRESFNGISLFADSQASSVPNPGVGELSPNLNKASIANDEGVMVTRFSRTLYTNPSGQAEDGNVSIGVTNLQHVLSLGALDSRYLTTATATAVTAAGGTNLGNVNSLNNDDLGGTGNSAFDEIYTSDGFLKSIMFVSVGQFTAAIERLADVRAENGAEQSRLNMTNELLIQNQTNLEAAHGRIMDADIALESTRFARHNVLVQASAAMVAQANQLTSIALSVLG
jgi:flagellin